MRVLRQRKNDGGIPNGRDINMQNKNGSNSSLKSSISYISYESVIFRRIDIEYMEMQLIFLLNTHRLPIMNSN